MTIIRFCSSSLPPPPPQAIRTPDPIKNLSSGSGWIYRPCVSLVVFIILKQCFITRWRKLINFKFSSNTLQGYIILCNGQLENLMHRKSGQPSWRAFSPSGSNISTIDDSSFGISGKVHKLVFLLKLLCVIHWLEQPLALRIVPVCLLVFALARISVLSDVDDARSKTMSSRRAGEMFVQRYICNLKITRKKRHSSDIINLTKTKNRKIFFVLFYLS